MANAYEGAVNIVHNTYLVAGTRAILEIKGPFAGPKRHDYVAHAIVDALANAGLLKGDADNG